MSDKHEVLPRENGGQLRLLAQGKLDTIQYLAVCTARAKNPGNSSLDLPEPVFEANQIARLQVMRCSSCYHGAVPRRFNK